MKLPKFKNRKFFEQAFIHRSHLHENYPKFDEGTLTDLRSLLVNTRTLAEVAKELNFGDLLKLSKGEEESKGRENISLLANCFEAFVGALFLDQGVTKVSDFLKDVLLSKTEMLLAQKVLKDPKSLLQEKIQAKKQISPSYKVLGEDGPAHRKVFTVGVYVEKSLLGKGTGKSKQEAEKNSAREALLKLRESG